LFAFLQKRCKNNALFLNAKVLAIFLHKKLSAGQKCFLNS
jgi:hypothetical protein